MNLRVDRANHELRINLHSEADLLHDALVADFCAKLNDAETEGPGTFFGA